MSVIEAIIGGIIGGALPTTVAYFLQKKQLTTNKAVEKRWEEYHEIIQELASELHRVKTWEERIPLEEKEKEEIKTGSYKTREIVRKLGVASLFLSEEAREEIENYLHKQMGIKQADIWGEHTADESYRKRVALLEDIIQKLRKCAKKEMSI